MSTRYAVRSVVLMALMALASATAGCRTEPGKAVAPPTRPPLEVSATPIRKVALMERLDAGGTVSARESAAISSRVVAPVIAVRVRAGDHVHAGDVLVTLDGREVAAQARQAAAALSVAEQTLPQAQSDLDAAQADLDLATAWHTRIAALRERNSATAQELDEANARLTSARARVSGARAAIGGADAGVTARRAAAEGAAAAETFTVIRAPFDGVVTERLVDPGTLAMPGVPLLKIDADGPRRVDLRMDEARVGYVRPGDHVTVLLAPAETGGGERPVEGIVDEVARAVGADQRAFSVKVRLPSIERARTGSFARVQFRGASRQALVAPASAIRRQGQVATMFVVQQGVARLRLVQLATPRNDDLEILAGADEGELVVVTPPPALVDGSAVVLTGGASPGARP